MKIVPKFSAEKNKDQKVILKNLEKEKISLINTLKIIQK